MNLHRQRDPTGVCALCPNGCCFCIPVRIPMLSSYPPCIQMASGSPASHMDSPPPDLVDHMFSNFFYIAHVFLNDFIGWRWGVTSAHGRNWPCDPCPREGRSSPCTECSQLCRRAPHRQATQSCLHPNPTGCSSGSQGEGTKTRAVALGNLELRSRRKEKGQNWSRQADL